jgi:stress-induced-phosphoprotein 1
LYVLEKYDECISTYEKALELEPANENTKTALEDAKTAKAQALRAQQAEANQMFNSFAQFFQGDVSAKARSHPETAAFANDPTFLANVKKIQANPNSILQLLGDKQIMAFVTAMLQTDQGAAGAFAREMEEEPAPTQEPPKQEAPPQEAPKKAAEPEKKVPELTEEQKAAADLKEKGNAAYKAKKFTEALDFYNQAQQVDPENMVYLNNKAAVYFEMEKYEECIKECEAAVELGRTRRADFKLIARAFARTGNAYAKLNNFDEAIKFYNKSLTEHRDAATLKSLRDVEKLKEDREKAAYLSPELSDKAREEGNTHFKAQEWPQAIKSYSEAIKRDPSKAVNYSNRAGMFCLMPATRIQD